MRNRLGAALGFMALALLCACDEKGGGAASSKDQDQLVRAPAQVLPPASSNPITTSSLSDLRDAVAATAGQTPGRDGFRKFYDNDSRDGRALALGADETGVSAGDGSTKKDPNALINAQPRANTLKINDVPSPIDGSSALVAQNDEPKKKAVNGKTTAVSTPMSQGDPLATSATGKKVKAKDPADEKKDQILIVGDSHSAVGAHTIGVELPKKLSGVNGRAVDVYAVGGASSNWYTPGKKTKVKLNNNVRSTLDMNGVDGVARLDELVTARTKVVIIVLGTNHLNWEGMKKGEDAKFYHLDASKTLAEAAAAGGRKCFWVGEPDMPGLKGTDAAKARKAIADYESKLEKAVGGACSYVKISDATSYKGGDGIHYGDYTKVAEAAAAKISLP